jgi:hypothetical protein
MFQCPTDNTNSRKSETIEGFGIPFDTDIIDDCRGKNDINGSYSLFPACYYRTGTRKSKGHIIWDGPHRAHLCSPMFFIPFAEGE